jgi:hypothetical protein
MHAAKLLHELLDNACHSVDKRLRKTLFLSAETLIISKKLSISGLGRSLNQIAKVKHNIKRMLNRTPMEPIEPQHNGATKTAA